MRRKLLLGSYAALAYLVGMSSLLYLVGFVIGAPLPKTIDAGTSAPLPATLATSVALLLAYLVPHSVMARPRFKAWWRRFVPAELERATYVLFAGVSTWVLIWAWQPLPLTIWEVDGPIGRAALLATYGAGWAIIVLASFHVDHLSFFGLRQVWDAIRAHPPRRTAFTARWLYGLVRHPISLGWLVVFWSTPRMTLGHLVFAVVVTLYIAIVTPLEEADLVADLGDEYVRYRERVRAFVPLPRSSRGAEPEPDGQR